MAIELLEVTFRWQWDRVAQVSAGSQGHSQVLRIGSNVQGTIEDQQGAARSLCSTCSRMWCADAAGCGVQHGTLEKDSSDYIHVLAWFSEMRSHLFGVVMLLVHFSVEYS